MFLYVNDHDLPSNILFRYLFDALEYVLESKVSLINSISVEARTWHRVYTPIFLHYN